MIFTPKGFLTIGGIVLVLVAVLGFMGVIGPTAEQSIFGATWYFDMAENWAHLILGVVGLIAAFTFNMEMQKYLVIILGVVGILVAAYNVYSTMLGAAMLQRPADLLLHLVVGLWALFAGMKKPAMMGGMTA